MPKIVRTYQQNFITSTANDIWNFTFAMIPHKAKPSNRFKVSVSSMSAYLSTSTGATVLISHAVWAKGLRNSVANTSAGDVNTRQVSGDTLLGILGNGSHITSGGSSTVKYANSLIGTPYYYYLDEMPTTPFQVYYTDISSYTYSSAVANLQLLISFLIEEEEE